MNTSHYHHARFLTSAAELSQLPADIGIEVAFAGRSNAGKSSALNAITGQKGLARVSKTPGRTRLINLFALDDHRRLVDLPGYGYAEVPAATKRQWQHTLSQYLQERESLKGLILLMDCRHPIKPQDKMMLEWCQASALNCRILLTKADKLSRQQQLKAAKELEAAIQKYGSSISAQLFSSTTSQGLKELTTVLDAWYN